MPDYQGRLELTWTNKDRRLLAHEDGSYEWVSPSDYRVAEVRLLHDVSTVGEVGKARAGDNLLIRGDALNALTSLAQLPEFAAEYLGKVKLCYIDPPFNTGQAFTSYDDNLEHSVWLTMLRDRLLQIKQLLTPDGSVWVHLDDEEVHRFRCVLDEVFGPTNFVATVIWQKAYSPRNDAPALSTDQDYILIYSNMPDWRSNRLDRFAERDALYKSPDGDPLPWVSGDPAAPSAHRNQTWVYAIQSPFTGDLVYPAVGRCWGSKQETMKEMVEEWGSEYELVDLDDAPKRALICGVPVAEVRQGVCALMVKGDLAPARERAERRYAEGAWPRLYFTRGGKGGLKLKRYLDKISQTTAPRTLWFNSEVGHNRTAKAEMNNLFPGVSVFATPKPERLLQRILQIGTNPGDVVLDCFLGSGTTAAVAHKMNRRWVGIERETATVETYALPRLTKVVAGDDPGGITSVKRPVGEDLPEGVKAGDARAAAKAIDALYKAGALDDVSDLDYSTVTSLVRALRAAEKTTTETTWHGGGGFRVLDVAPSMFEADGGLVFLADWMTNGALAEATAAQLGFTYENDPPFSGRKGRTRLAVVDGVVNESVVRLVVSALPEKERVVVCGTGVDTDARPILRELRPGSTLRKIPAALLDEYRSARQLRLDLAASNAAHDPVDRPDPVGAKA
ncbi:MAG: site-specific DNA-methyltransferase [Actinomycetota bacterium]|nr:site-specific DNA-methyltransferase [Actinomycetota bacterium]